MCVWQHICCIARLLTALLAAVAVAVAVAVAAAGTAYFNVDGNTGELKVTLFKLQHRTAYRMPWAPQSLAQLNQLVLQLLPLLLVPLRVCIVQVLQGMLYTGVSTPAAAAFAVCY
jgi:hypothetical protein